MGLGRYNGIAFLLALLALWELALRQNGSMR